MVLKAFFHVNKVSASKTLPNVQIQKSAKADHF
jgi:hypothetical protein